MFFKALDMIGESGWEIADTVFGGKVAPHVAPGLSPEQVEALSQMHAYNAHAQAQVAAQQQVQSLVNAQQARFDHVTDRLEARLEQAMDRASETGDWSHVAELQDQFNNAWYTPSSSMGDMVRQSGMDRELVNDIRVEINDLVADMKPHLPDIVEAGSPYIDEVMRGANPADFADEFAMNLAPDADSIFHTLSGHLDNAANLIAEAKIAELHGDFAHSWNMDALDDVRDAYIDHLQGFNFGADNLQSIMDSSLQQVLQTGDLSAGLTQFAQQVTVMPHDMAFSFLEQMGIADMNPYVLKAIAPKLDDLGQDLSQYADEATIAIADRMDEIAHGADPSQYLMETWHELAPDVQAGIVNTIQSHVDGFADAFSNLQVDAMGMPTDFFYEMHPQMQQFGFDSMSDVALRPWEAFDVEAVGWDHPFAGGTHAASVGDYGVDIT